jgi:single-stranded-DNA-specific exonuclease
MSVGIRCLIEDDFDQAMALASELDAMNQERREIESQAREEAAAQASAALAHVDLDPGLGIVLHDSGWHQGVIGLIAGKLKEQFYRPTIVLTDDGDSGRVKGSCRSIPGVHIRDVLERIDTLNPGLLIAFGGHAMAAGLSLLAADLERFKEEFHRVLAGVIAPEALQQTLEIDGPLQTTDLRLDIAYLLGDQVWGQGFPAPVFVNDFTVISQRRLKERHLKLLLSLDVSEAGHPESARRPGPKVQSYEAIWFNALQDLPARARLAYRLSSNEWQGRSSVQLEIVGVA